MESKNSKRYVKKGTGEAGDYRKQVQLPIVECGAKNAPFIGSEGIASDKTYYPQCNRFWSEKCLAYSGSIMKILMKRILKMDYIQQITKQLNKMSGRLPAIAYRRKESFLYAHPKGNRKILPQSRK